MYRALCSGNEANPTEVKDPRSPARGAVEGAKRTRLWGRAKTTEVDDAP